MLRLNPSALDDARKLHGFTSDTRLAGALGMSESAVRNLRHGKSTPSIGTLMKLRKLTGIPVESMVIEEAENQAAA